MTRNLIQEELIHITARCAWRRIFYSPNKSKIEACNANMNEIDYPWDIVVLVSDDMIPQIQGWDDVIRSHMMARFPDTDGILWFNDGCQADRLNTLTIYGRKMYESLGNLYEPEYKSLFCDTELTDRCRGDLKNKCLYVPYCIIRHEHPGAGFAKNMDGLYMKNQTYWSTDMMTYIRRKTYPYDWSVLIPTIPGREERLQKLCKDIYEKAGRIAPNLKIEICLDFDNRESSVGTKRQRLLEKASGKYLSFIDDDDDITDAYIEDLAETIRGSYPVMRLRGVITPYTFTHSIANTLKHPMAIGDVFLRPPNHLNPMLSDVAKLVPFKDAFRGEDLEWTIRMARSGFLTREYASDDSRIHYMYNLGGRKVDPQTLMNQQQTPYETMLTMVWKSNGASAPEVLPQTQQPPKLRLGSRGFVSK